MDGRRWRRCARVPSNLVLLDIEMPEMNGYETLDALQADAKLRDIPVVMILGGGGRQRRALHRGGRRGLRLRDQHRELFRKFATAEVAEELMSSGFTLGGKHVDATVMFCDIRGFTGLAESLPPAETIELLNSYYTLMFDAIESQGGVVNQIVGDGLMALFGAPVPREDHRAHAVEAALEMLELVAGFEREQVARGKPVIKIGIGIASGQVIAGYTGTERRVTYTCVGDTVVVGAHLEQHTKVLNRPILIDETTRAGLGSTMRVEDHGMVQLKTRSRPVHVYSVVPPT
jgi:class 3 adenylate cyclase